ncbi:hypothetical protein PENSPDRAFT_659293 [Peniophora sp. CONT]|nr:hypothetical protein PENSPDRAFT_659293 [Peniophora sp. CONT]
MDHTAVLPADLLCRIFLLVQALDPILLPGPNWIPDLPIDISSDEKSTIRRASKVDAKDLPATRRLAWIALTHVGSRWRSVAIEQRGLWASPSLYLGLQWFNTMLSRSDGTLLNLSGHDCGLEVHHMAFRSQALQMVSTLVREQPERIRSLRFGSTNGLIFLYMPYDTLQKFELHIPPTAVDWFGTEAPVPPGTVNLFNGQAPHLRSLHLSMQEMQYEQLPRDSAIWSRLEHLHLALSGTLSSILRILRHSTSLRSLFLHAQCGIKHTFHGEPDLDCGACLKSGFNPISIPSLLNIKLRGCIRMLAHLLNHMHCHSAMKIQIHSESQESAEATALAQLRRIVEFDDVRAPAARAVALIGESRVELCISSSETALLAFHRRHSDDEATRNDSDVELCLALHYNNIRQLVSNLGDTRILTISRPAGSSNDGVPQHHFTRQDFLSFTSVRHLTISGADINASIPMLGLRKGQDPSTILFPSLHTLSIGGSTAWSLISALPKLEKMETIAMWLHQILRSRWAIGKRPVKRLFLHIAEELVDIQAERWELTSCSKYLQDVGKVVQKRLKPMQAIPGRVLLPYDAVLVLDTDVSKIGFIRRGVD